MIKKLTIPRESWNHGRGGEAPDSALYVPDDETMCFTGFFCEALGFERHNMKGLGLPLNLIPSESQLNRDSETADQLDGLVKWDDDIYGNVKEQWCSSKLCMDLIDVNDDIAAPDDEREAKLIELCAEAGIEVEFTGKCTTDHAKWSAQKEED